MEPTTEADDNRKAGQNLNEPKEGPPYFRANPKRPVRIIVSTATHLVPGVGYSARTAFMRNTICRYHWGRDFDSRRERFEAFRATFAFDKHACHFLLDHGDAGDREEKGIPVFWYSWTGKFLEPTKGQEALFQSIKRKLKERPFQVRGDPFPMPRDQPTQIETLLKIRSRLYQEKLLSRSDLEFLEASAARIRWMENNLEPRVLPRLATVRAVWREFNEMTPAERAQLRDRRQKAASEQAPIVESIQ